MRTGILLSTDFDESYVQDEGQRILNALTIWNEMDKTKCYPKDIDETAFVKDYDAISQQPKTYYESNV